MPGQFLHRLSTIGCNDFSREHVIEPLLADMQQEWAARRSVVALIRGYLACWSSLVVCFSRSMMTFPDREIAVRAIAPYVLATGAVMVLRLIGWAGWTRFGWRSTLIMALGALGFSPVFAMLPAMMKARRDVQARWSADFTKLLIAGAIVSAICVGWIGPELFRWYEVEFMHFPVASAGSQPAFQTLPTAAARAIAGATADETFLFRRELLGRAIMVVSAGLLGIIGWNLAGIRKPTRVSMTVMWFAFMELTIAVGAYNRETLLQMWYPPIALAAFAGAIAIFARRRATVVAG